jgi:hypothetical protein
MASYTESKQIPVPLRWMTRRVSIGCPGHGGIGWSSSGSARCGSSMAPSTTDGVVGRPLTKAETNTGRDGMPQQAWSQKRERQYQHIKGGLRQRGESEDVAEEIAARTVNKERARAGEAKESSSTSIRDISSGRRGGLRSHRGAGGRTKDQLYAEARRKGVDGRSKMTKAELARAVDR